MLQTNWRCIIKYGILFIALVSMLMACSSSDSDPAPGPNPDPNPNPDPGPTPLDTSTLNGIWSGEYGDNNETIIFMMKDGEIFTLTAEGEAHAVYFGTYTYSEPNIFRTNIQNSVVTIEVNGTASVGNQIEVAYTSSNGNKGSANLRFSDGYYNRASSFELISGEWASDTTNYSIDTEGGVTASNVECQLSGAISIIDPEHNLYVFDIDLTECDEDNGQYSGLSYLFDTEAGQNQSFIILACNDETKNCIGFTADRQ